MNLLILEDTQVFAQFVEKAVKETHKHIHIYVAKTFEEAVELMGNERIDIGLLDVELGSENPKHNGLEFARRLVAQFPLIKIVFMSSHADYALSAYDVHAFDFVTKPVSLQRLKEAICSVITEVERQNQRLFPQAETSCSDKLFIRMNREMLLLPYDEILFIEKVDKDVLIHTAQSQYTVKWTLTELEQLLPKNFVRTHRSYIVNSGKIVKISEFGDRTYEIFFECPKQCALMSRYKINELFEVLNVPFKE